MEINNEILKKFPIELQIELAENHFRKAHTQSEIARIQKHIVEQLGNYTRQGKRTDLDTTSSKYLEKVDVHGTLGAVAKLFGESHETTRKRLAIYEAAKGDEQSSKLLKNLDQGKSTVSKTFKKIQRHETKKKMVAQAKVTPLPEKVQLVRSSFEESKLAENSVDLVLCDPPYGKDDLVTYKGIARLAMRILKPGGSCVVYCGHHMLLEIGKVMEDTGLKYWHQLILLHNGRKASLFGRQVFVNYKPLLWFVKGDRPNCKEFLNDVISNSKEADKLLHRWQQDTAESCYVIEHLTYEGQLVVDPCCGSGTTLVAALMLERKAVGYEIDEETAEIAQGRIAQWLASSGSNGAKSAQSMG